MNKQLKTLLEKQRKGSFLPITHRQIVLSYILLGSLVYTLLIVFTGLLRASKGHLILLFAGLYIPIAAIDVFIAIKGHKFKKPVQMVIRISSIMLGYLLVA